MKKRLAIVASHVIQYQDPLFRRLAADPDIELTVFFCSRQGAVDYRDVDMATTLRWDLELLSGYRHAFLRNIGSGQGFFRLVNPGLVPALTNGNFDLVLFMTGWAWMSAWIGFAACRVAGVPFALYGDSSFVTPPRALRDAVMRGLFRATSAFMISGTLNASYYRHYGAEERRFHPMPWAIDNERFIEASRFAPGERDALRASWELTPADTVFVFSGKLIERKDPSIVLRAASRMHNRAVVLFLGDGVLREPLERQARELGVEARFAGFVNQTSIPKLYAMCDAFVLPSHFDPRATVVNEAMACGLPVIITSRCGPSADIVRHGENGFVFQPGDEPALATHMDALAGDPELRASMSRRSRAIIDGWSYAEDVAGVKEALNAAGGTP